MSIDELLPELHQLTRAEKLRVMQFLVLELAKEEDVPVKLNSQYTIWTPYDSFGAAQKLRAILKAEETGEHD